MKKYCTMLRSVEGRWLKKKKETGSSCSCMPGETLHQSLHLELKLQLRDKRPSKGSLPITLAHSLCHFFRVCSFACFLLVRVTGYCVISVFHEFCVSFLQICTTRLRSKIKNNILIYLKHNNTVTFINI